MAEMISYEPATGAELWRGIAGDVDGEVAAARAGWTDWARRTFEERAEILRRFADIVRTHGDSFADIIARETGKPLWEAKGEVDAVIGKVGISIAAYGERTAQRSMEGALGARNHVRHKPHGVLAVLGPYNFPAHLPNGHIVPALLAGNAIVFKPSEKTPASGAFLVDLFHEAGVPETVIRIVQGGRDEGKALAGHAGIDGLLFTGSAGAGAALSRQFADTPQRILALELGGNNPLVVWDTPDIAAAATIVVQSGYLSAGQRCTCGRRLIVRDGAEGPLLEEVGKILDRIIIGGPHDEPAPFMGPVIDNDAATQVLAAYDRLVANGAVVLRAMTRPDPAKPFLTPGLIDVTNVADLPDEEIFGPLVQLIRVPDFDAAITAANATRYGLAASVVTDDAALYDRFWAGVRAGVINWNRPTNGAPSNAPFGGVGISGNHRPSAFYAADYCAYPVTSVEAEEARATIGQGLLQS
jgi:succinylglutamic semialdehyde dehydrogenase